MTGGYISIKDEVLNAGYNRTITGSFEYAKSLISANKPIFGVRMVSDGNKKEYLCTYIGCVVQNSSYEIRIIISTISFDSSDYMPDSSYTIITIDGDDIVSVE